MSCRCCSDPNLEGTNRFFTRWSRWYARKFRSGHLEKIQRHLLDGIRNEGVAGVRLLDIGCGVGGLHLTLLQEGAAAATGVDIAEGMIAAARRNATRLGVDKRSAYRVGDFVRLADEVSRADVTMLDKVVCCYRDVDALVRSATEKTDKTFAFSHPRQTLLAELVFRATILLAKFSKDAFTPVWHDWARIHEDVQQQGFEKVFERPTIVWNAAVYRRVGR